jgi:Tol biopolymer transport system component
VKIPQASRFACAALLPLALAPLLVAEEARGEEESCDESAFLTRVHRLTFEGRRAGEGYFSTDGRFLVFQSEREPGNPFFQIYEMDLQTGDVRRISTGAGKTTCAFHRPGASDIVFGSTHHDPRSAELQREELERRAAGEEDRYAWDFDPEMEIWVHDGKSDEPVRLTDARGYDAEASYSPDGERIVFTSTRGAYERELSENERKQLEVDPSYFAEIYVMRADGGDVTRLTDTPGYDGGPFFTPDGERIVWRRFDEQGLVADIWSMRIDGSDPRRLTDFGSMSWAPYPHPSGDYIVFTSNKLGFENFELFLVDSAGLKEPVRVTCTAGFDGLPVSSPDGRRLAWTATRAGETGQIFIGEWNHEQALRALEQAPARGESEEP